MTFQVSNGQKVTFFSKHNGEVVRCTKTAFKTVDKCKKKYLAIFHRNSCVMCKENFINLSFIHSKCEKLRLIKLAISFQQVMHFSVFFRGWDFIYSKHLLVPKYAFIQNARKMKIAVKSSFCQLSLFFILYDAYLLTACYIFFNVLLFVRKCSWYCSKTSTVSLVFTTEISCSLEWISRLASILQKLGFSSQEIPAIWECLEKSVSLVHNTRKFLLPHKKRYIQKIWH